MQTQKKTMPKNFRAPCIGGCGREVVPTLSAECRKCRRARLRAGQKRIHRKAVDARSATQRRRHVKVSEL